MSQGVWISWTRILLASRNTKRRSSASLILSQRAEAMSLSRDEESQGAKSHFLQTRREVGHPQHRFPAFESAKAGAASFVVCRRSRASPLSGYFPVAA